MNFGNYIKSIRLERGVTLRDFCRQLDIDPSNWSKVERGKLPPPKSKLMLESIAKKLGIEDGTEEWYAIFDLAVTAFIPTELIGDEDITNSLPMFFRTIRGRKPSNDDLRELVEKIRKE